MFSEKQLYRHFGKILFLLNFLAGLWVWYQGRQLGLFAAPAPGMDQHTILKTALAMGEGLLPVPGKYLYSPAYTLFLALTGKLTGGNPAAMRLIQLALSSLIPWMIYRAGIYARFGRQAAAVAGVLWLFCGSALLISLDFLRAAPLALCFIAFFYFCLRSLRCRSKMKYSARAGAFAALCVLGRENFIPVVCLPLLFFFLPRYKSSRFKRCGICILTALLVLAPVLLYNFYHVKSLAILPGNGKNVFEFMQGKNTLASPGKAVLLVIRKLPQTVCSMISPFENPNSLSFYAHREIIPFLKVLSLPLTLLLAFLPSLLLERKKEGYLLLLLIASYFGSLVFCEIYYRFRIPVLPLVCLGAAAGAFKLKKALCKRKAASLLCLLPVAGAVFWVISFVPAKQLPRTEREATVRFFLDRKMYTRAGELLQHYRKCGVPSPAGERLLIAFLLRSGEKNEAFYWHETFKAAADARR